MLDNNERVWLMQGDCLERMQQIPSGSVDMVLTHQLLFDTVHETSMTVEHKHD